MSYRKGEVRRIPIMRIGWRDALRLVKEDGFRVWGPRKDGVIELLNPRDRGAMWYLTKASAEKLAKALVS